MCSLLIIIVLKPVDVIGIFVERVITPLIADVEYEKNKGGHTRCQSQDIYDRYRFVPGVSPECDREIALKNNGTPSENVKGIQAQTQQALIPVPQVSLKVAFLPVNRRKDFLHIPYDGIALLVFGHSLEKPAGQPGWLTLST
jgi:hypothetical protein